MLFLLLLIAVNFWPLHTNEVENTTILTCLNETECNDLAQSVTYPEYATVEETTVIDESNTSIESTTPFSFNYNQRHRTVRPKVNATQPLPVVRNRSIHKIQSNICECDLTLSACDINCCCDPDCKEYQLTAFSYCEDHPSELYDSRYCYSRNFIQHNNTQFILEKLSDNLFCIVYDNLPPMYSVADTVIINNYKDFKKAINPSKLKWKWKKPHSMTEFNRSYYYQDTDILWAIENTTIKPIEVLQKGFSELCSFKKMLKYLQDWDTSCMQTDLQNTNTYLFPTAYNNLTVLASPHLFNKTFTASGNQMCPKDICLPITSNYCFDHWDNCNSTKPFSTSCLNGTCYNVVKGVKYLIVHNGTMGIKNITVYFHISNISNSFHQYFEVRYRWINLPEESNYIRSGNPGYIFGKPLIIGSLISNKTNNLETKYIFHNFTDRVLSLPISKRNGQCSRTDRYIVNFGEDVKSRCLITLKTNNFTTQSCMSLQNETLKIWLKESLLNYTQKNQYNLYVSKLGNFTDNRTTSWLQLVIDKIPQNVITGYIDNGKLKCTGLISSIHYEILYSVLSKPQSLTNHEILGIGITFPDEIDTAWVKCNTKNCVDVLTLDITSYVTFHDISKSSKYYFVGGPHLDISLPYDFFYPFLSSSETVHSPFILLFTATIAFLNIFVTNIFL